MFPCKLQDGCRAQGSSPVSGVWFEYLAPPRGQRQNNSSAAGQINEPRRSFLQKSYCNIIDSHIWFIDDSNIHWDRKEKGFEER